MFQGRMPTPPIQFGDMFPDHMRRYLFWFVILLLLAGWAFFIQSRDDDEQDGSGAGGRSSRTVEVDRVVDGDTAKVFIDGESEYVRYIGIDTPESVAQGQPVECFGQESKNFNESLLTVGEVRLVFDEEQRDQYGRLLAYVYAEGRMLNEELLRNGYATTLEISPNTAHADRFADLEAQARDSSRGLWAYC
jgi:micrococcal nuclease